MNSICIDIAEVDQVLRTELKSALKACGYSVREFDSGYPIIGMMDGWPDVFLIDIELHDVNGMEVCKWLKSREGSKRIPVGLMSRDPYLRTLAASSHADDYLEEPFTAADVVQKVSEICRHTLPSSHPVVSWIFFYAKCESLPHKNQS